MSFNKNFTGCDNLKSIQDGGYGYLDYYKERVYIFYDEKNVKCQVLVYMYYKSPIHEVT